MCACANGAYRLDVRGRTPVQVWRLRVQAVVEGGAGGQGVVGGRPGLALQAGQLALARQREHRLLRHSHRRIHRPAADQITLVSHQSTLCNK